MNPPIDQPISELPSASPISELHPPIELAEQFYRLHPGHIPFSELVKASSTFVALRAWPILRVFGKGVPCSSDHPPVKSLDPFLTLPPEMPAQLKAEIDSRCSELARLGFHSPLYHAIDDPLHLSKHLFITFAHSHLPVIARVHLRIWLLKKPAVPRLFVEFISQIPGKGFVWTLNSSFDIGAPDAWLVTHEPKSSIDDLFKRHMQNLPVYSGGAQPAPAAIEMDALRIAGALHQSVTEFHLRRGLFVPLDDQERLLLRSQLTTRADGATNGESPQPFKHPAVIIELNRLLHAKSNPMLAVVLLAVSLLLFILIGINGWGWKNLFILVPVLLFHELGHLAAMKMFGYRNLKMFFIPGFGAAVTGRSFGISGWKKAVVSLMGPVPGILLGIVIGLTGAVIHSPTTVHVAIMAISINAFNLVPLLPFDGGHVVRTVLFSRHPVLDIAFRSLAVVSLLGLTFLSGGQWMIGLIVLTIMTLPASYAVAKVAGDLKARDMKVESPDGVTIPPAVADEIADALISKHPQSNKLPKAVAQNVLSVFETLNTPAPGVLASFSLLTVHALSFIAAVLFAAILVFTQRGGGEFIRAAVNQPQHTYTSNAASAQPVNPSPLASPDLSAVYATFPSESAAKAAHSALQPRLAKNEQSLVFASTLVVLFPKDDQARRDSWFTELNSKTELTFVAPRASDASMRIECLAPSTDAAKAIADELNAYFHLPGDGHYIAPWSPVHTLSQQQAAARSTFVRIREIEINAHKSPAYQELSKQMVLAMKRGDRAASSKLSEQSAKVINDHTRKGILALAADPPSPQSDPELATQYAKIVDEFPPEKYKERQAAFTRQLGPRLGTVPEGSTDKSSAHFAFAHNASLLVDINELNFEDPVSGSDALVRWLISKGCRTFRYDLFSATSEDDPDEPVEPAPAPKSADAPPAENPPPPVKENSP